MSYLSQCAGRNSLLISNLWKNICKKLYGLNIKQGIYGNKLARTEINLCLDKRLKIGLGGLRVQTV